jgi:hypothetical protein
MEKCQPRLARDVPRGEQPRELALDGVHHRAVAVQVECEKTNFENSFFSTS